MSTTNDGMQPEIMIVACAVIVRELAAPTLRGELQETVRCELARAGLDWTDHQLEKCLRIAVDAGLCYRLPVISAGGTLRTQVYYRDVGALLIWLAATPEWTFDHATYFADRRDTNRGDTISGVAPGLVSLAAGDSIHLDALPPDTKPSPVHSPEGTDSARVQVAAAGPLPVIPQSYDDRQYASPVAIAEEAKRRGYDVDYRALCKVKGLPDNKQKGKGKRKLLRKTAVRWIKDHCPRSRLAVSPKPHDRKVSEQPPDPDDDELIFNFHPPRKPEERIRRYLKANGAMSEAMLALNLELDPLDVHQVFKDNPSKYVETSNGWNVR